MKQKRFAVATSTLLSAIFITVAPLANGQSLPEPGGAAAPSAPAVSAVPIAPVATAAPAPTTAQTPAAKAPWRAKITESGAPGAINSSFTPAPSYQTYGTRPNPKVTWMCSGGRTVYILDEKPIIQDMRPLQKTSPAPRPPSAAKKHD